MRRALCGSGKRATLVLLVLLPACSFLRPNPVPAIPENASPASWVLDPDAPAPAPEATQFVALVNEQACSSGRPIEGLLLPPVINYGEREIVVSLYLRSLPPGPQFCVGRAPTRFVIELDQPIAGRRLIDGLTFHGEGRAPPLTRDL